MFGIGIIGCGNISEAYLELAPLFKGIRILACADIDLDSTQSRAGQFGVDGLSVDALLARDDIDIVVNLTTPAAHFEVTKQALESGKHVYSEKPYVLTTAEALELSKVAKKKGVRIGSAPDTFLGGAHQHARHLIDSGIVGNITSGTAHVMGFGMEHWHPNPDFFYQPGAGPVLDIGPYYITNLIQLIGPVKRVASMSSTPRTTRTISSEPRAGESIPVDTPTTIHALLEFASGAVVTLGTSWDVWQNGHYNMELYGDKGTLYVPDPNFFGGEVVVTNLSETVEDLPPYDHPFSKPNQEHESGMRANYRVSGLADMAASIEKNEPHRCSAELALHAVDVMTSILKSGEIGEFVALSTSCERPAALGLDEATALLA